MSPATLELRAPSGTRLAFDFGVKRIGVAIGVVIADPPLAQSRPLTTIVGEGNAERFAAIARLIETWQPVVLVVGRPLALDGDSHAMTLRCERFARQLHGRFGLPVELADERLTSAEAEARLRDAGIHHNKSDVDALAAQVILESHLDAQLHA